MILIDIEWSSKDIRMTFAIKPSIVEEILDFLTTEPNLEDMLAFQPSEAIRERAHYLLEQNRLEMLTPDERAELDEFTRMNHFVNMLKIRARLKLNSQ
jgi:hypothetical protein